MRRDHLNAVLSQLRIQRIAVIGAIADQVFRLGFDHVEVETQLHQTHFVMVRRVRADRERQSMAIHNRHDFHAFSALRSSDFQPASRSSTVRWLTEPVPAVPMVIFPGLDLALAISSGRVLAGNEGLTSITSGARVMPETATISRLKSKFGFS